MKQNKVYIYGKHAVGEALLHARHALNRVYVDHRSVDSELLKQIQKAGVEVSELSEGISRADLKSGTSHQGIMGQMLLHELVLPYQKFTDSLVPSKDTALVLLGGVEDPHNMGAIIRSAAGFGASGVLMPERGQSPVTGTVIKVSAGMAFRIPLVSMSDTPATILDLKKRGFKVYALEGDGSKNIGEEVFDAPAVFILGNEGEGVPHNLRKLCDTVLSIPISKKTESLNVAASAAVVLFAWSTKHPNALGQK